MRWRTKHILASGAVIAASVLGVATQSAAADTSTLQLGCFVDTPALDFVQPDHCGARLAAARYSVYFEVLGRSGGGYSYQWQTSGLSVVPLSGCTSSAPTCSVSVRPRGDATLTASVVVTELATGASKTVTAD